MRNRLRTMLVLVTCLVSSSCAFIDNEVQLEYQNVASIPENVDKNEGTIYMSLFEDRRSDRSKVGVIRNGYGMETASVLTKDDAAIWVSNSVKKNLERRGYLVETVSVEFSPKPDQLYISGKINKIFSDPRMGFFTVTIIGDVQATLQAQYNGRTKLELIAGQSQTEDMVSSGGELHKGVLNKALVDFVEKVVRWIDGLKT